MPECRYRILAIASHPVQYMSPIFRRLAARPNIDLHVAYCSLDGAELAHDPEFDTAIRWDIPLLDGYSWTHVRKRWSGAEFLLGAYNPGLWKIVREGNFDAALCFTGYRCATFWIAWLAAISSRTAFLFGTDSTTLAPRDGRSWKTALKRLVWPRLFRLADQVIVPSSDSRDLMFSLGVPVDRVTLTPYSVDNDWWIQQAASVDRNAIRATWGASASDIVILFCAKLQPWKRPFDLIRAFAKANVPKAILVYAGEGPLRSELESEAALLGIASRTRFLGFVNQSQLPAVYSSVDLMVLPSEYEPFAVVVNEAMCCGCPVIASDRVGAARDLIAPVCAEMIYPCGNIDALASILRSAAVDSARLEALADACSLHIRSWSPEKNISATIEAVRAAVSRLGRSSHNLRPGSPDPQNAAVAPQTPRE
jgi:glycosyltransferase involved in cell wall biosynthesis